MNKQKTISLLLSTTMILGAIPNSFAVAQEDSAKLVPVEIQTLATAESDFTFSNGTITKYNGSDAVVTIPSTIGGVPVTAIGDDAFRGRSTLTSVTIPDSVTSIGENSFYGCTSLTTVAIPDSVTSIGVGAFYNCTSLTTVTIPDSVTSIGDWAFSYNSSLTTVTIPNSVTSIGMMAFNDCTSLTTVTIPDSVTSIGIAAFNDCTSLTTVTIPDSVTSIESSTFKECTSLTTVTLPISVTNIHLTAFDKCTALTTVYYAGTETDREAIVIDTESMAQGFIDSVNNSLENATWVYGKESSPQATEKSDFDFENGTITKYNGTDTEVVIPSTIGGVPVTEIGYEAFRSCSTLTTVNIPDSVTSIGERAFFYCKSLTTVTIPDSVTSIGDEAFAECSSLTTVNIPDSVTSIGYETFWRCSTLTTVNIPDTVTSIGAHAFDSCTALTTINIPDSVTTIGAGAFLYCYALTSLDIPNSVTTIGNGAFGCNSLTSVSLPNSITSLVYSLFTNCRSLTSVTIPDSVTSIERGAFEWCEVMSFVTIPISVTNIHLTAFNECTALTTVYYAGSETDREAIVIDSTGMTQEYIDSVNDSLENATWVYHSQGPSIQDIQYTNLPIATQYSSYLSSITDMSTTASIVSGALPLGLGIYPDGTIGGIPTQTGTFSFVVSTAVGEQGYTLTVQDNSSVNVEADNDFDIITRIPTVESNEMDYVFEVSGEFSQFLNLYLNGVLLIRDVDYYVEEGSTIATLLANTMAQLNTGTHTINATYAPQGVTATAVSAPVTVEKVAQTFEKTVPKTTEPALPFSDVTTAHWFYDQVLFVYKRGTFGGMTPNTYAPDLTTSRAMMAMVLYALADKPATHSAGYPDMVEGLWYSDAVNWLGVTGISDCTIDFRPDEAITREETAEMIYNFCVSEDIWLPLSSSNAPNDLDAVSQYVRTHVSELYQRGIFDGDDLGNFNPQNTATRAEISTVMKNFISVVM